MRYFFTLILCFIFLTGSTQNSIFYDTEDLIENKKYESAYLVLNRIDPHNDYPEILIYKLELILNYYTSSIMHKYFGLKNLDSDENIEDLRGKITNENLYYFDADSLIRRLINVYPDNFSLKKALGDYYFDVYRRFNSNWYVSDSILVPEFGENYQEAYEHGIYDYRSLYGIGFYYFFSKNFPGSIIYFKKSIELDENFPLSYYYLAYVYFYLNEFDESILYAEKASELLENPRYKADAFRLLGALYYEKKNFQKAYTYLKEANEILPNDYYIVRTLLEVEVILNRNTYRNRTQEFFNLAPYNPLIYQDIINIYLTNKKATEVLNFFERQKRNFEDNPEIMGNIYYYIGVVQFDEQEFKKARKSFQRAYDILIEIYPETHPIFQTLEIYQQSF